MTVMGPGVEIVGPPVTGEDLVLTPGAVAFVADLERRFRDERRALLERRASRHAEMDRGVLPGFLKIGRAHV